MRKLIVALAFGALLLPGEGFALGLGEIEVRSALNQEFNAEIELLSAAPEDVETLIVKLAPREEFSRAGIDRPYFLNDLRFVSKVVNGRPVILVSTSKPVREPYLDFLIEVDWPKGHLMREYTVLLDPPVFLGKESAPTSRPATESRPQAPAQTQPVAPADSGPRPAVSARPAPVVAPVPVPVTPEADESSMRPAQMRDSTAEAPMAEAEPEMAAAAVSEPERYVPAPVTRPTTQYRAPPGGYRIQQGDTAWSLADAMRPDQSVSIQQMMLALLRSNPEAFIEENINGLKRGYILRVPDRSFIEAIDRQEALAEVQQHHSLWREYQAKLSGKPLPAPDTEAGPDVEAEQPADSGLTLDDLGETDDAQLEIVSAGSGAAVAGSDKDPTEMTPEELRAQLALAEEQLESERLQKEGMEGEVEALEGQVDKMKRLLAIEDENLAQMQEAGTTAESEPMTETEQEVAAGEAEMATETEAMAETPAEMLDETGEVIEQAAEEAAEEFEQIAEDAEAVVEEAAPELAEVEPMPAETEPAEDLFRPQQPENPVLALLDNPIVLGAAGAGLLFIMLLVYLLIKRKRDANEEQEAAQAVFETDLEGVADLVDDSAVSAEVSDHEVEQEMAAADNAEPDNIDDFDTESTMVLPAADDTVVTSAEPSAESEDEEPRDDVIAEADVYLAYGIYQQAEELLQNALNENPERDDYRAKLCETHFAAKNAEAFSKMATELHQRQGGKETPMWQKVVVMGKELCPNDALFKGGMVPDVAVDDLMPSPEPMDFDLGDETGSDEPLDLPGSDTDTSELEFDLGEIDTGTETADDTDAAAEDSGDLEFDLSTEDNGDLGLATSALEDSGADEGLDLELGDTADEAELDAEPALDLDVDAGELELDTDSTMVISDEDTGAGDADDDEEIDFSDLSDVDEIATKLDLARAYLDMGDSEGTRSILEEVLADGNDEQKKDAEELLKQVEG